MKLVCNLQKSISQHDNPQKGEFRCFCSLDSAFVFVSSLQLLLAFTEVTPSVNTIKGINGDLNDFCSDQPLSIFLSVMTRLQI